MPLRVGMTRGNCQIRSAVSASRSNLACTCSVTTFMFSMIHSGRLNTRLLMRWMMIRSSEKVVRKTPRYVSFTLPLPVGLIATRRPLMSNWFDDPAAFGPHSARPFWRDAMRL